MSGSTPQPPGGNVTANNPGIINQVHVNTALPEPAKVEGVDLNGFERAWLSVGNGVVWLVQNPEWFLKWMATLLAFQVVWTLGFRAEVLAPFLGIDLTSCTTPASTASPSPASTP